MRWTTCSWGGHVGREAIVLAEQLEITENRGERGTQLELVLDLHGAHQVGDLLVGEGGAQLLAGGTAHLPSRRGEGGAGAGIIAHPVGVVVELLTLDCSVRRHVLL